MTATAIASTPTAASWTGTQPTAPARADRAHPKYAALYRFAAAITAFNFIGHTVLGFEQAWLHPFVALAAAYATELLLEGVDAWSKGRAPRWQGDGVMGLVRFLLPAHISAMAVSMLLYSNATFLPIAFAAAVAIASKYVFRMTYGGRLRHFLNPSNFGITVTLVTFHWVGIAAPYMFTENLYGWQNWILPVVIVCSGSFLNTRFTKKMPLIFAWLGAFALQAGVRHVA
ncbi:MAG: enediyne biosynthesis protein, partial [Acidobacteriota bacterium]